MARILLADDEEALRLTMGRQLRRAGYEVTLAEDGMAAAELLGQEPFDVVVSDMKMPRLDGMGLLYCQRDILRLFRPDLIPRESHLCPCKV